MAQSMISLKGQCYEIFDIFFIKKTPPVLHINRQKRFSKIFCFREDIRKKTLSALSLTTRTRDF